MKKANNKNYLDYIPVKNSDIEYTTEENGRVTVMIEWKGFYHKIAQKFFHRPRVSDIKLDEKFDPDYMFDFFGKLHNVPAERLEERKEELFSYFGIREFSRKPIKELSTGMKQKAAIAVSLAHDPQVIIFDEPTNGLDIITARNVTDYLRKLREEGKLILVSTHIMSEAEKLCDRIGIIIDGCKVAEGTLEELLRRTGTKDLEDAFFELYKARKGEV